MNGNIVAKELLKVAVLLQAAFDDDRAIENEWNSLRRTSIEGLRKEYKRSRKIVDTSELSKRIMIEDLLVDRFGRDRMQQWWDKGSKKAADIDPKYQNTNDTFKDMPPVDDPAGAKNGFNGCVRYMMDKKHKGLAQENAEKLCGYIKQHKG